MKTKSGSSIFPIKQQETRDWLPSGKSSNDTATVTGTTDNYNSSKATINNNHYFACCNGPQNDATPRVDTGKEIVRTLTNFIEGIT